MDPAVIGFDRINPATRAWLARVLISIAAALAAGALAYLVARGVAGALLLAQQQRLLGEVTGALRGGIEGLPSGDLRAARLALQQLDAQYEQASLLCGIAAAALAAVAAYLWLERRAGAPSVRALGGE